MFTQCRDEYGEGASVYNDWLAREKAQLVNRLMSEIFGTSLYLSDEWDGLLNDKALQNALGGESRSLELLNDIENALTISSRVRLNRATSDGASIVIHFDGQTVSDHVRGAVRRSLSRNEIEQNKNLKWVMDWANNPQDFGCTITATWSMVGDEMRYQVVQAKALRMNKWSKLLKADAEKLVKAIAGRFNEGTRVPENSARGGGRPR